MALDNGIAQYDAPEKGLYEVGEMPPMGYVPKQMYAWTIRRERPDALWASREMLGHTDRFMQEIYRSDFAESGAIRAMDQLYAELERAGRASNSQRP